MPINQDQFLGYNAKICVTYPINANIAIIISDFQQKYVVAKAMRISGGISKKLLMKKLKSKVYISFRISLYEESLVSSNLNSKQLWFYIAHPNVGMYLK